MQPNQASSANLLIQSMPTADFELLQPDLRRVELERGKVVGEAGHAAEFVYFPEGGVFSIVSGLSDAIPTEVGLFGREGMSNLEATLGSGQSAFRTLVQIDGHTALRVPADRFILCFDGSAELRSLVLKFTRVMMIQIAQSLVSQTHNHMAARLARWLLMCCDRLSSDEMTLTHEFISTMLGVQRSSVTVTLHVLEGVGAIRSTRGLVTVRDREKLKDLAGDAYGGAEHEYNRLIGRFGGDA